MILCGLGRLGFFIAEGLLERGEKLLIVELDIYLTFSMSAIADEKFLSQSPPQPDEHPEPPPPSPAPLSPP